MTEFNSTVFLQELDSFGQPPPPQKIVAKFSATNISQKLDQINRDRQGKLRDAYILPADNGMVKLGRNVREEKQKIKAEEANKWRSDVLKECRPRVSSHPVDTVSPREQTFSLENRVNLSSHIYEDEDDASISNPQQLRVKTLPHHERRSSDYSSASSTSQKSPSPPSQSSYSDYASLYKSQTASPITISPTATDSSANTSNVSSFNTAFRNSANVPIVIADTRNRFSPVSPSASSKTYGNTSKYGTSLTQQMRLTDDKAAGRPPAFKSITSTNTQKWKDIATKLESDDRKLEFLTKQLKEDLVIERKNTVGSCNNCNKLILSSEGYTSVSDKTYHTQCFICDVCGKELNEQQFHFQNDRIFCKQHFFNDQMVAKKETYCSKCRLPIDEMILTALDRKYHPACFCCTDCGKCLDGIPFSIDKNSQPYCLPDYHNRFAPRCARCALPITPQKDTGETIRIVALENSYHIECYVCEGCGVALADGPEARCYPLGNHLLCKKCHIHWASSRTEPPLTDL
ncbi:unnamed protein product [Auanema sp. JU1783]|nr:unnamed protein product [Auanema sp. JU1783]